MRLPIAANWFTTREITPSLTLITEPHTDEMVSANTWWLRGSDRDVVIDTGLGVGSLRLELPALFESDVMAIVTHAHLDHSGGAHEFEQVAVHSEERTRVESPAPMTLRGPELFRRLGIHPVHDAPGLLITALPSEGYDPDAYLLSAASVTRLLEHGDTIDLGNTALTVLHLPGHTPGSIALLDERRGILFTGDVVYDDVLLDDITDASIPDYLASMRTLASLEVDVVHPGHGPSFDGRRLGELAREYPVRRG